VAQASSRANAAGNTCKHVAPQAKLPLPSLGRTSTATGAFTHRRGSIPSILLEAAWQLQEDLSFFMPPDIWCCNFIRCILRSKDWMAVCQVQRPLTTRGLRSAIA
jgi:hypothetical protein